MRVDIRIGAILQIDCRPVRDHIPRVLVSPNGLVPDGIISTSVYKSNNKGERLRPFSPRTEPRLG